MQGMKAVILAGGRGTRIAEETATTPKPMILVGGKPMLWHIMKIYSTAGVTDFVICLGYKGYVIKEYFSNYFLHTADVTFDLAKRSMEVHQNFAEPWRVTLVDTGETTMTGGRLKRVRDHVGDQDFCMTYGDGVANIDLKQVVAFHRGHGRLATVTAVQPPSRFGALQIVGDQAVSFHEKPRGDGGWINGGFFVLSPKVFDLIEGDSTVWEREPMQRLSTENNLRVHHHSDFWHAMDTVRDRDHLEELWASGRAPWRLW
jgi:glucose-1-phosphate cytidylyltransferase